MIHENYDKILSLLSNPNPDIQMLGEQLLVSSNMSETEKEFLRVEADMLKMTRNLELADAIVKKAEEKLRMKQNNNPSGFDTERYEINYV